MRDIKSKGQGADVNQQTRYFALSSNAINEGNVVGVVRELRDAKATRYERIDSGGRWVADSSLARIVRDGESDWDVREITDVEVDKFIKQLQARPVDGKIVPPSPGPGAKWRDVGYISSATPAEWDLLRDVAFAEIVDAMGSSTTASQRALVRQALELANNAHSDQLRDDQTPYIFHPLRTADIMLREFGIGSCEAVCAALLHDTMEDSSVNKAEISHKFGSRVADIVEVLTKDLSQVTFQSYLERIATHQDDLMATIKLADRLDNVRSLHVCPDAEKRARYLQETIKYFLPLAQRQGPLIEQLLRTAIKDAENSI